MARRPQGPFNQHSPTARDLVDPTKEAQDDSAYEVLVEFLPMSTMQTHVDTYFNAHREATSRAACLDVVAALSGHLPVDERQKLAAMIESAEHRVAYNSEEEAETARRALVGYWLSTVDHGFRTLAEHGRLELSKALLPARPSDPNQLEKWEAWNERRKRSVSSLLNSVALTPEGLSDATMTFCRNVASHATPTLPVPPDYALHATRGRYELRLA